MFDADLYQTEGICDEAHTGQVRRSSIGPESFGKLRTGDWVAC